MALDIERLQELAQPPHKSDIEGAAFRKDNREWLNLSARIALNIRYALRLKGMTQSDLATQLGLSPQNVAKFLSGRQNFTIQTVCRIEKTLGVNLINAAELKDVIPANPEVVHYEITSTADSADKATFSSNTKGVA